MNMTLRDFIVNNYDVRDRISYLTSDPVKRLIESDGFPYDFIEDQDGTLTKMLYFANGEQTISVLDLLSYKREDLVRANDTDLLELYDNYTSNIKFEDLLELDPVQLRQLREESIRNKGALLK